MLERIEGAKSKISVATIALSTAAAVALDHMLASPLKQWSVGFAVVVVAISACAFQFGSEAAINRSVRLRRLISGDDYIEGTWLEVYRPADAERNHYGVVTIAYHAGKLVVTGFTYRGSVNITERGVWKSEASHYSEGGLVYFYEETAKDRNIMGSGRLDFNKAGGYPVRYLSQFAGPIDSLNASGNGFKLEDSDDLEAVRKGGSELEALFRKYDQTFGIETQVRLSLLAAKRWHEL